MIENEDQYEKLRKTTEELSKRFAEIQNEPNAESEILKELFQDCLSLLNSLTGVLNDLLERRIPQLSQQIERLSQEKSRIDNHPTYIQ